MYRRAGVVTVLALLSGCADQDVRIVFEDGFMYGCPDGGAGTPPDLLPPPAKCAAAKGLMGDSLVCVDFSAMTLADLTSQGWDFASLGGNCWEIVNGKLQVKNFSTFMSSCGFTMKGLSAEEYQKYGSFTLSVVQTVDVNATKQNASIYLSVAQPAQVMASSAGTFPRQRNVYEITKGALPNGGNNSYQPLFQITSSVAAGGTAQGWQIESIAVLGLP